MFRQPREAAHPAGLPLGRAERGMVTAELAVATLAALTVMLMLCWMVFVVIMQLRCVDTAAEVARQAARGDAAAVRRAERDAPIGARVTVRSTGPVTVVDVRLDARPPLPNLPKVPLSARAQVVNEPGDAE